MGKALKGYKPYPKRDPIGKNHVELPPFPDYSQFDNTNCGQWVNKLTQFGDNYFGFSYLDTDFKKVFFFFAGKDKIRDYSCKSEHTVKEEIIPRVLELNGITNIDTPKSTTPTQKVSYKVYYSPKNIPDQNKRPGGYLSTYQQYKPNTFKINTINISGPSKIGGIGSIVLLVMSVYSGYKKYKLQQKHLDLIAKIRDDLYSLEQAQDILELASKQLPEYLVADGKILADVCNCICDGRLPLRSEGKYDNELYRDMVFKLASDISINKSDFQYIKGEIIIEVDADFEERDSNGNRVVLDRPMNKTPKIIIREPTCPKTRKAVENWRKTYPPVY